MSVASQQDEAVGAQPCQGCGATLPLRAPVEEEQVRDWICVSCGEIHPGVLNLDQKEAFGKNVRPTQISFGTNPAPNNELNNIREFAIGLERENDGLKEKRISDRYDFMTTVQAIPVDDQFRPTSDAEELLSRNISTLGISLIHTKAITTKYLALEFNQPDGNKLQVVMEVLRCRPFGPYREIGGRFVTKMGM